MGGLFLIFILGFVTFLIGSSYKKEIVREREIAEQNSIKYHHFLANKTQHLNRYLSLSERREFTEQCLQKATFQLAINCSQYRQSTLKYLDKLNEEFLEREEQRCDPLFSDILGHSLDKQQRDAVMRDEDYHLIVAGAGAGKTLTIVGKVAYLCSAKGVSPKDILLISFTNKAAEEMTERLTKQLGKPVTAYTFHKLGLGIIRKHMSAAPNIADDNALEGIINRYFEQSLDASATDDNKFLNFLAYYLYVPADKQEFQSLGEYIEAERGTDMETLKSKYEKRKGIPDKISIYGEHMKSQEEVMIANFLFLNGVKYKYEQPYPHTTEFTYRPDFFLPDYGIYLEHFGIDKDGKCAWLPPIEAQKYVQDIERKRQIHAEHNTKLLETYSYYQHDGILLEKLKEILIAHGIKLHPIAKDTVLKEIFMRDDRGLKGLNKLLSSFVHLFKAQGYTSKDFSALETKFPGNTYHQERCKLFFSIVEDIYEEYESALEKTRSIDFSDMIIKATEIVKDAPNRLPYKYVIIDEYQDMGRDRYHLVKAILETTKAKLVCIGDDWQSIYRFNGSDVRLFTSFEQYWGQGYISRIEKTYRNSQELINICGRFIMRNSAQIRKELVSSKSTPDPVRKAEYAKDEKQACLEQILDDIFDKYGESTVFLLGRNNYDIDFIDKSEKSNLKVLRSSTGVKLRYNKHPELKISFLTVHKSKGLEADNVVIINCANDYFGFPNKIEDDPILQLLLSDAEPYRYAEERRLMYVALTRTKNMTYLLVPKKDPSEFVTELNGMGVVDIEGKEADTWGDIWGDKNAETISCPRCKTGKLVKRSVNGSDFYGCSNYPKCTYACKNPSKHICPKCGGIMVLRESKFGKFYGCSNYPLCKYTFDADPKRQIQRRYSNRSRYSRKRWY